jgi:phosphatidylserine decarboxylase
VLYLNDSTANNGTKGQILHISQKTYHIQYFVHIHLAKVVIIIEKGSPEEIEPAPASRLVSLLLDSTYSHAHVDSAEPALDLHSFYLVYRLSVGKFHRQHPPMAGSLPP